MNDSRVESVISNAEKFSNIFEEYGKSLEEFSIKYDSLYNELQKADKRETTVISKSTYEKLPDDMKVKGTDGNSVEYEDLSAGAMLDLVSKLNVSDGRSAYNLLPEDEKKDDLGNNVTYDELSSSLKEYYAKRAGIIDIEVEKDKKYNEVKEEINKFVHDYVASAYKTTKELEKIKRSISDDIEFMKLDKESLTLSTKKNELELNTLLAKVNDPDFTKLPLDERKEVYAKLPELNKNIKLNGLMAKVNDAVISASKSFITLYDYVISELNNNVDKCFSNANDLSDYRIEDKMSIMSKVSELMSLFANSKDNYDKVKDAIADIKSDCKELRKDDSKHIKDFVKNVNNITNKYSKAIEELENGKIELAKSQEEQVIDPQEDKEEKVQEGIPEIDTSAEVVSSDEKKEETIETPTVIGGEDKTIETPDLGEEVKPKEDDDKVQRVVAGRSSEKLIKNTLETDNLLARILDKKRENRLNSERLGKIIVAIGAAGMFFTGPVVPAIVIAAGLLTPKAAKEYLKAIHRDTYEKLQSVADEINSNLGLDGEDKIFIYHDNERHTLNYAYKNKGETIILDSHSNSPLLLKNCSDMKLADYINDRLNDLFKDQNERNGARFTDPGWVSVDIDNLEAAFIGEGGYVGEDFFLRYAEDPIKKNKKKLSEKLSEKLKGIFALKDEEYEDEDEDVDIKTVETVNEDAELENLEDEINKLRSVDQKEIREISDALGNDSDLVSGVNEDLESEAIAGANNNTEVLSEGELLEEPQISQVIPTLEETPVQNVIPTLDETPVSELITALNETPDQDVNGQVIDTDQLINSVPSQFSVDQMSDEALAAYFGQEGISRGSR